MPVLDSHDPKPLRTSPSEGHYTGAVADRFWARVDRSTAGCWHWIGPVRQGGYATVKVAGRTMYAHRLAYELTIGPIPAGAMVCHHCDNRKCVHPDHLYAGDQRSNMDDMVRRGRASRANSKPARLPGESNGQSKLTEAAVRAIRAAGPGVPRSELAARFGVDPSLISHVRARRCWAHVA